MKPRPFLLCSLVAFVAFVPSAFAAPAVAQTLPARDVAAKFIAALQADSFDAVAALAEGDRPLARRWKAVTEVIDRFDCISVSHVEAHASPEAGGATLVVIDVDGTAVTAGRPKQPERLPITWYIEAVPSPNGFRVVQAASSERRAARAIVSGRMSLAEALGDSRNEPRTLLRDTADEASEVIREIIDESSGLTIERARDTATEVLAVARAWHDQEIESLALRRLEVLDIAAGHPDLAMAAARESMTVAEKTGDADLIAGAHFAIGTVDRLTGDLPAAIAEFRAGGSTIAAQNDPREGMRSLHMVAIVNLQLDHIRDVMAAEQELSRWLEEFNWPEGRRYVANHRASVFERVGDFERARDAYQEMHDAARRIGDTTLMTVALYGVADMDVAMGRGSAARLLQEVADLSGKYARPLQSTALLNLANDLVGTGHYSEADDALCRAFATAGPRIEIASAPIDDWTKFDLLASEAELRHGQGRDREALPIATEARIVLQRTAEKPRAFTTTPAGRLDLVTGRILRALGRREDAIEELARGVEAIESSRAQLSGGPLASIRFLRDKLAAYRELVDALQEEGRVEEALAAGEQMKSRALRDILERSDRGAGEGESSAPPELKKMEETLNARIVTLNRELRTATGAAQRVAIQRQLERTRFELDDLVLSMRVLTIDAGPAQAVEPRAIIDRLRQELPEEAVVLEYVVLDRHTIAFTIARNGGRLRVASHVIPIPRAQLEKKVDRLVTMTATSDLDWPAASRDLYDTLIAPVAPALRGRTLLCIVPDGVLWKLPFSVLGPGPQTTLLDRVAVAYAPSLATLRASRRTDASAPLLALADPIDRTTRPASPSRLRYGMLQPLPEAKQEVRAIARLYPTSRVLTGADAAERVVKEHAAEYRVIHLATHGLLDSVSPLYSAVVLATSDREDGLLEAREILDMRLGADLVVLSACETAGGDVAPGEGLIGMSWALMVAGCPTSIVSQWKVDSRSTADVMVDMHRGLVGGLTAAKALRRAQLQLRRDPHYRHPFYWAPFVVMGSAW